MSPLLRLITNTRRLSPNHQYQTNRTLVDISTINWVRDRALDHAVEKENNLKPVINIKNFIKSEPSKSVPISIIVDKKETLEIPIRPIDFIRRYPSIFEQFLPGGIGVHPHIRLTPEVLNLDEEEQLMCQGQSFRKQAADRLLKLLMLCRINKIPLHIVDRLKWDLGLPQDYVQTLVPEFPDYFQIIDTGNRKHGSNDNLVLELVCWNSELAVSVIEKNAMNGKTRYTKGMPIEFPMQYSRGFEMDKKFKKWVDDWQKLGYISPYDNAFHLPPTSDEADKWAVSVLHELLHILVPKKSDKENILAIGEYLGLRSRFKRVMLHHPGIFYVSSKVGTHTVVLREGYKRDLLIEKHVLMGMRSQYVHLMNTVKESPKPVTTTSAKKPKAITQDSKSKEEDGEEKLVNFSDSEEMEETSNDEFDDDEEDDSEDEGLNNGVRGGRKPNGINPQMKRSRIRPSRIRARENPVERDIAYEPKEKGSSKFSKRNENTVERDIAKPKGKDSSKFSKRIARNIRENVEGKLPERSNSPRGRGRSSADKRRSAS